LQLSSALALGLKARVDSEAQKRDKQKQSDAASHRRRNHSSDYRHLRPS